MADTPPTTLRIACLEPSATAICLELGLGDSIVGVTHECDPILDHYFGEATASRPLVLTKCGLNVTSQADIHLAIQKTVASASCPIRTTTPLEDSIPSTYPLIKERLQAANPTVIFTQDLCDVCAPTTADVKRCLWNHSSNQEISIVSLQPTDLHEVTDTFVTIADACGIPERGRTMRDDFLKRLKDIRHAVETNRSKNEPVPTLFILEWLDPVFDSGHWTYQMMEYAGVRSPRPKKDTHKAVVIEWEDVYKADPDVIVVGCCGFDLERNIRDTLLKKKQLSELRARIYASNGDWYIAQPAPFLLQGVALLAQCAYQHQPSVLEAIAELGFETIGWQAVDVTRDEKEEQKQQTKPDAKANNCVLGDMEDILPNQDHPGFAKLHDMACEQGEMTYEDPDTGYAVFTRLAHEKRGKCCGSGCRHCPYSHANVKDKASKTQQPSILYEEDSQSRMFSIRDHPNVKVLFFSGGKDSFLAIRALVRSYYKDGPFGLILMTTFDANTRVIAHQEVGIDQVIKQAAHLDITLVGIPLRRGSGETYTDRIQSGLKAIRSFLPSESGLTSLVFGDLHLSHVKEWRDKILTQLDCELEYPLWKKTYTDLLADLESSKVPCQVSGSTREEEVPVGTAFDRNLYYRLIDSDIDEFGECGEFHSLAMVWEVPRTTALGLRSE